MADQNVSFHGRCNIQVPPMKTELYQWDFSTSKRSLLISNMSRLNQTSYEFNGLKFAGGILGCIGHDWSVSISPSPSCCISTTLDFSEISSTEVSCIRGILQLWSDGKAVHQQSFRLVKTPYTSKNSWTSRSEIPDNLWTDSINNIRFILEIDFQKVAICSSYAGLEPLKKKAQRSQDSSPKIIGPVTVQYAKELLESGHLSDVKLVCEGSEILAHRMILACRSPVFKRMFEHSEFKEGQEGRVVFEDIELSTLNRMIKFLYTGELKELKDNAIQLYKIADRYEILDLKGLCSNQLFVNLNADNAVELYGLGSMYGDEPLMTAALHILQHKRKAAFKDQDTFKEFCLLYPEVMFRIFQSC